MAKCRLCVWLAGLMFALAAPTLAEDATASYPRLLDNLPGPVPVVTASSCLAGASDDGGSAELLDRYTVVFDAAAAQDVLRRIEVLVDAVPTANVPPISAADLGSDSPEISLAKDFRSLGLDPDNALDAAVVYLSVIAIAQSGDLAPLSADGRAIMSVVRAQVIGGEMRCFSLGALGPDLAAARNEMVALTILLMHAIEAQSLQGGVEPLGSVVKKVFGDQISGLTLGPKGFVAP